MSKNFNLIKIYYETKLWSKQRVRNVVGKPAGVTEEEYKIITGEEYNMTGKEVVE